MSAENDVDLDRLHGLMMAALDGECSPADRQELDAVLRGRADLRAEWDRLRRVKEVTTGMRLADPPDEVWDRYRASVLYRAERGIAWVLIAVGAAVLGTAGVWHWIQAWLASKAPLYLMAAVAALMLGLALLLVSVVRERWLMYRRDPYSKGVLR